MTQKKRKFSEHILSISSKEQNLDIPKLESSQAPEANEPIATCRAVVQDASGSATAAQGQNNRGKRVIHVSSKQSGMPGVSWTWRSKLGSWQVFWHEEKNMKKKYFHVRHFMKTSKTFCEAEVDALRAAIEFRKDLERSGIAKAKRVENFQSGVKGITWHNRLQTWQVQLKINGKLIPGGYFKPKDSTPEEVERARLAAVEGRHKLEEKYFTIKQSAGQIPASPVQQHSAATASSIAQGTKRAGASSKAADARLSVLNRKRKGAGQLPVWAARAAVGLGLHQVLAHHVECAPPHTGPHRKIAQLVREVI